MKSISSPIDATDQSPSARAAGRESVLAWAWRASASVDSSVKLRTKFVLAALRNPALAKRLQDVDLNSPMGRLLSEWPDTLVYLVSPYQCAAWDAPTRFARIDAHQNAVEAIAGLRLSPDDKLALADLSAISPDTRVILDRAKWLSREGHLTLSLFKGQFRAFTLSFSLSDHPQTEIFVGGIQGRQSVDVLALYRDLTKEFHGIRPRDFMLEALRLFACKIGARHIFAVADEHKISRHRYFKGTGAPGLYYDEIWEERGGARLADTHFELPLGGSRRDLEDVSPKKRSMYRRRYQMLDEIADLIPADLALAERMQFDAS